MSIQESHVLPKQESHVLSKQESLVLPKQESLLFQKSRIARSDPSHSKNRTLLIPTIYRKWSWRPLFQKLAFSTRHPPAFSTRLQPAFSTRLPPAFSTRLHSTFSTRLNSVFSTRLHSAFSTRLHSVSSTRLLRQFSPLAFSVSFLHSSSFHFSPLVFSSV